MRRTLTVDNGRMDRVPYPPSHHEAPGLLCLSMQLGNAARMKTPMGLLHDYYPKHTDLSAITARRFAQVVEELNKYNKTSQMPRLSNASLSLARAVGVALQP